MYHQTPGTNSPAKLLTWAWCSVMLSWTSAWHTYRVTVLKKRKKEDSRIYYFIAVVEEILEYKFLSRKGAEKWGGEEGQPKKLRLCGKPQLNLIIGRLVKKIRQV